MFTSMTGYGRAAHSTEDWTCEVELRAVNHRFLDLNTVLRGLPRSFESRVNGLVRRALRRGRIDVTVVAARGDSTPDGHRLDGRLARRLVESARELCRELAMAPEIRLGELLQIPGVVTSGDGGWRDSGPAPPIDLVQLTVERALALLTENRQREGARLRSALQVELEGLVDLVERLDEHRVALRSQVLERYRARLQGWLREATGEDGGDAAPEARRDEAVERPTIWSLPSAERLVQEAAVSAERGDVEEEIVRLRSHLGALRALLETGQPRPAGKDDPGDAVPASSSAESVGKKIEFLVQEIVRELSTVSAKGRDAAISHLVVEARGCCERLKEQAANLE
ncbi:MAG: DUF1732 domain-containing protein [Acidobacteria bacterium]|nr:MAG: DUF1732 domain-containing protein [Acidobacteriota bacterium]REK01043.1 MAG: DUF1732 domain-containing protein [Acidobacteriota bacterium]